LARQLAARAIREKTQPLAFLNQLSLLTKDRFVLGTALVPLHPENPINLQGLHFGVSYEGRVKITAHGHVLIEMV
jgi:hypothetical protein